MEATLDRRQAEVRTESPTGIMTLNRTAVATADGHAAMAGLLCDAGQFDAAIGAALVATEMDPANARAQAELGRAFFMAGQTQAALLPCANAVALAPANLGAVVTFGAVLFTLGRFDDALETAVDALRLDSGHFQARANLALALEGLGRFEEAEVQSGLALASDPSSAVARHNLASLRLSQGKLDARSWELYESRLELTAHARAIARIARWRGEDPNGATVLLHAEQGLGDVIQFARYAPLVRERGARVVLAVSKPLVRLMAGIDGVDAVVEAGSLPHYDLFCPIASLPGVFGTSLETIPAPVPYLAAPAAAAARFRPPPDAQLEVGLVWAGNPGFVHDRFRSIPPGALSTLSGLQGVRFHSLQKDGTPPFPMLDRMGEVEDLADTAGMVAHLDLVIAVDTAVAHLAAAMGKPVWLLSRHMGCWRWLRDREDSPWYPTMRVFHQDTPGDWTSVLARVRRELTVRAAP